MGVIYFLSFSDLDCSLREQLEADLVCKCLIGRAFTVGTNDTETLLHPKGPPHSVDLGKVTRDAGST
jgi:hypothetical protein